MIPLAQFPECRAELVDPAASDENSSPAESPTPPTPYERARSQFRYLRFSTLELGDTLHENCTLQSGMRITLTPKPLNASEVVSTCVQKPRERR
jgi:hypothetical protein